MTQEKCKYCGTSFFKIIEKKETYVFYDGTTKTRSWRGCASCWNNLQKVS